MFGSAAKAAQRAVKGWFEGEGQEKLMTPAGEAALFKLHLGALEVGTLALMDGMWDFQYSDAFRAQSGGGVQPLVDFPDVGKSYRSPHLWPFFVARIPSVAQPRILEEIQRRGLDQTSVPQLLRAFGQRSIANPFQLRSA